MFFFYGYVDLCLLIGVGLGVVVYDYDGIVYLFDEVCMFVFMGDCLFVFGWVD